MSAHLRIFVINLARSPERRRAMAGRLDELGLDREFFPALFAFRPDQDVRKDAASLEIGEIVIVPDLVTARQAVSSQAFGQSYGILRK